MEVTKNLPAYFAGRLYDALWGSGVISKDDSVLRRIIISRAERDLGSIAQEYYLRYGSTLKDDIEVLAGHSLTAAPGHIQFNTRERNHVINILIY